MVRVAVGAFGFDLVLLLIVYARILSIVTVSPAMMILLIFFINLNRGKIDNLMF